MKKYYYKLLIKLSNAISMKNCIKIYIININIIFRKCLKISLKNCFKFFILALLLRKIIIRNSVDLK